MVDPVRESGLVLAAQQQLPVLVMLMPLGRTHKRLETHVARGDWTCSVLKFEEQPGKALPYLKPGGANKYSEDRGRDTRDGWKKAGDESSYQSCWREAVDMKRASSACTVFLPPPLSVQGTATEFLSVLHGWIVFVLVLKTSPGFVQHLFALWWRYREALNMEQTSATHLEVPSHMSQSERVLCYTKYVPVQCARAETLPACSQA